MRSIDTALNWFQQRRGAVYYSMTYRNGQVVNGRPNFDCSSAVYYALIEAGFLRQGTWIGNTDSLFRDLEANGWVQVQEVNGYIDAKRGDVFIWGVRGASGGAFGHTGMFTSPSNIIHCSSGYNGIHEDNHDWLHKINGYPANTIYRYVGGSTPAPAPNDPNDQNVDVGSYIKFLDTYAVDDMIEVGGRWEVRTNALCPSGFAWADNGIPVEPLVEIDANGYATSDQDLHIGELYKIPGKYKVLGINNRDNIWLAQIESNGLKFWVDLASATEVPELDQGTPVPSQKPADPEPTQPDPELPEDPTTPEVPVEPEQPTNPVDPEVPTVPINDPIEPPVQPENPIVRLVRMIGELFIRLYKLFRGEK